METTKYRFCKKCLTRDLIDKDQYFKSLQEYIENLDIDIKATQDLYEERLGICLNCDFLLEGMCKTCGCYVELRAAITKNYCPNKKW